MDPPEVTARLWRYYKGAVGWDIGANCGQTIPLMLERFDQVIAFEPAAECAPWLNAIKGNLTWYPTALSDNDDHIDLIELPDKIDTGQLVTGGTTGMEWNPDVPGAHTRTVPCRSVDGLMKDGILPAPDFMKIDVEGHETRVLFGAKRTLAVKRPDLLVEFHSLTQFQSVMTMAETYGYAAEVVRHPHYPAGSDLWANHGWIRARQ